MAVRTVNGRDAPRPQTTGFSVFSAKFLGTSSTKKGWTVPPMRSSEWTSRRGTGARLQPLVDTIHLDGPQDRTMASRSLTETSKFLSYVLRHAPESIGVEAMRKLIVETVPR